MGGVAVGMREPAAENGGWVARGTGGRADPFVGSLVSSVKVCVRIRGGLVGGWMVGGWLGDC